MSRLCIPYHVSLPLPSTFKKIWAPSGAHTDRSVESLVPGATSPSALRHVILDDQLRAVGQDDVPAASCGGSCVTYICSSHGFGLVIEEQAGKDCQGEKNVGHGFKPNIVFHGQSLQSFGSLIKIWV